MSIDDHKAVVHRFYERVVNAGDLDLLDDITHEDMTDHAALAMGVGHGREGFRRHISAVRTAVPDFVAKVERVVAEDDVVVVFWTASGTTAEEFVDFAADTPFTVEAVSRLRFDGDRIAEYRVMVGRTS